MLPIDPLPAKPTRSFFFSNYDALLTAWIFFLASSLIVVIGAVFGHHYLVLGKFIEAKESDFVGSFAAWDGEHYVRIAQEGYSYDANELSNVAFFPAYPLTGRFIANATGWRMDLSLLIASYVFLMGSFVAVTYYTNDPIRSSPFSKSEATHLERAQMTAPRTFVLLAFGFFPTTFYFRMAYSESFFVFEVILTLYGMKKGWSIWALVAVIGLATATRGAGIALLAPLLWHVWNRSPTWNGFFFKSLFIVPAACWGLAAYMIYLYLAFGDPLAFARTQKYWDQRPAISLANQLWLELTLEPINCEYDSSCRCHQLHSGADPSPIFSMYFANPLFFLLFLALMAYGAVEGWLSSEEILAGTALLLFSYLSKSYTTCMCSQARYASTVFPAYIVLGRLLQNLPIPLVASILSIFGFFLGIYSALFVRWYGFY